MNACPDFRRMLGIRSRQVIELQKSNGLLNTMVLDTTQELEEKLTPVRLPIDKGRRLFKIDNPLLPAGSSDIDKRWLYEPTK